MRLLGEESAKAVNAAYFVANQIPSHNERIAELRRLWETAKVSLPDEVVMYDIASQLGCQLGERGQFEEAKVFFLAALEENRSVLREEQRDNPHFAEQHGGIPS